MTMTKDEIRKAADELAARVDRKPTRLVVTTREKEEEKLTEEQTLFRRGLYRMVELGRELKAREKVADAEDHHEVSKSVSHEEYLQESTGEVNNGRLREMVTILVQNHKMEPHRLVQLDFRSPEAFIGSLSGQELLEFKRLDREF